MADLWFETALLPEGWAEGVAVSVDGGRIAAVRSGAEPAGERHAIGLPGMIDIHSHGFQRALVGLTQRRGPAADDFWSWRAAMYGFLDALGPDEVEAVTAQAYAEMLEAGFVRVAEFHYLHNDPAGAPYANRAELAARVAAAAETSGIGLTLLPVFYAHGGFGGMEPEPAQRRFVTGLDGFARLLDGCAAALQGLPGARLGVAPHSLRAVTPDELAAVAAMRPGDPVHIHIAEQTGEVEGCLAWSGARPVEWLLEHADVDARWTAIHATHMTDAEVAGLAASGAVAGLCPTTEADLGDGVFRARDWMAAGGAIAIGSDSNVIVDPARELQALEHSQRLMLRARNVLASEGEGASTGGTLYRTALAGGGRGAGAGGQGIAPGTPADLVSLDRGHPALAHLAGDALLDAWIFSGRGDMVDRVWVGGREVVRGGRHRDREAIAARFRRTMARLTA